LKAIADLVQPSVQMIRGALCVICMDPDAPLASLWADGKPIINTAAVTAVQTALKTALNSLRGMAKDCVEMTKNIVSSQETATGQTCAAAQELLTKIETESTPCADEANATKPVSTTLLQPTPSTVLALLSVMLPLMLEEFSLLLSHLLPMEELKLHQTQQKTIIWSFQVTEPLLHNPRHN